MKLKEILLIIKYLICLLILNNTSFTKADEINTFSIKEKIIWYGSKESVILKNIKSNNIEIFIPKNKDLLNLSDFSSPNKFYIRDSYDQYHIDIQNKKTLLWITAEITSLKNSNIIDLNEFKNEVISNSYCDPVITEINFSESTPKSIVRFNYKKIGLIDSDGRFYYHSGAVCKDKTIYILVSKEKCKDNTQSFKAINNPHTFIGKVKLDCGN